MQKKVFRRSGMMDYQPEKPLVVQRDLSILIEAHHTDYEDIRKTIAAFADLKKSLEHIHTYQMSSLSLWNAASAGWNAEGVIDILQGHSKFPLTPSIIEQISREMNRFGLLKLIGRDGQIFLTSCNKEVLQKLTQYTSMKKYFIRSIVKEAFNGEILYMNQINQENRGELKQACMQLGYPVTDEAGYFEGDPLNVQWQGFLSDGSSFDLRTYQREAIAAFKKGGQGVLVLPCGAGKTIIGIAAMVEQQCETLILTTHNESVKQWKREILEKTNLQKEQVSEYSGQIKGITPVTIATYNILTYRSSAETDFVHFNLFKKRNWGLIIYDEVHLLPAPVFRATAEIQSTKRLGLTATLIREDGKEGDVFSLIGPKRYEMPWKQLESQGHISKAHCVEVRVPFDPHFKEAYYQANLQRKFRIAQENPLKTRALEAILRKHQGEPTLIIGQYVRQIEGIGVLLNVPVITGKLKHDERDLLYEQFRQGGICVLAVSKVANFAIDLPDATVAIQISGTYGSRQEEAQRLGRILRPKKGLNHAWFYHVVTADSKDQEFASKRKLYLTEQGYHYYITDEVDSIDYVQQ